MDRIRKLGTALWGSLGNIIMIAGWLGSSALLAWSVRSAGVLRDYAPFSWVAAGFVGLLLGAIAYVIWGFGRNLSAKAKARKKFLREGDAIDPMATIFENRRIHISDLANPFEQIVKGKKFIGCELIGPASLIPLLGSGKFVRNNFVASDSIEIRDKAVPQNAIAFLDCDFEDCRFYKVSLLFMSSFRQGADELITGMNWLTAIEEPTLELEDQGERQPGTRGFFRRLVGGNG